MCVVRIAVTKNKLCWCHGYLLVKNADCRLQTADRIQNVDEVQNVDCRLQIGYKMQTEDLKSFFVWYVITCHLTTYRASRNYFSAVSFHDYLHYFEIFPAHFLMKIDRTIISNLHSLLTLRASWLV